MLKGSFTSTIQPNRLVSQVRIDSAVFNHTFLKIKLRRTHQYCFPNLFITAIARNITSIVMLPLRYSHVITSLRTSWSSRMNSWLGNVWIKWTQHGRRYVRYLSTVCCITLSVSVPCLFITESFISTVTPNLNMVNTVQFARHNQSPFLWCPAEGAPAPRIIWRKNEIVVQNSTSIRYKLAVDGTKDNYSCEVNSHGNLTKKELVVLIESEWIILHTSTSACMCMKTVSFNPFTDCTKRVT